MKCQTVVANAYVSVLLFMGKVCPIYQTTHLLSASAAWRIECDELMIRIYELRQLLHIFLDFEQVWSPFVRRAFPQIVALICSLGSRID